RLVCLSRGAFHREDRRPLFRGSRCSMRAGSGEHQRSRGRVYPVAIKVEDGVATQYNEELLIGGGVALIMLVDDRTSGRPGAPGRHPECRDAKAMSNRPVVALSVREL